MLYRPFYALTRRVIVGVSILAIAACDDSSRPRSIVAPPKNPLRDVGPINRVVVTDPGFVIPGYHRSVNSSCIGYDYFAEVSKSNPRSWSVRSSSNASITPHYLPGDSGSTATLTGGASVGNTYLLCTITQPSPYSTSKTDSVFIQNLPAPTYSITQNAGNPTSIPPGAQRTFNFTLHGVFGVISPATLNFTVTGNGTKVSQSGTSVTVQAGGGVGSTLTITASYSTTITDLVNASNLPYSASTNLPVQVSVDYDPLVVWPTGDQTICAAGSYQWGLIPSGGDGSYSYQWSIYWYNTGTTLQLGTGQSQSLYLTTAEGDFIISADITSAGQYKNIWLDVRNRGDGNC